MIRTELDQIIHFAKDQILLLGSMVEDAMYCSVRALKDHDFDTSQTILENDQMIHRKRFEIESAVISSIARQQPIARDLRLFASVLDLCTELERIGDYAKGIAVINLRSGGLHLPKILNDIYYMSEQVLDMFHHALTAFVQEDAQAARSIAQEDHRIEALYMQVYVEVIDLVVAHTNNMQRGNYALCVAHHLERMADRVTNVCERTLFIATGELSEISDTLRHPVRY